MSSSAYINSLALSTRTSSSSHVDFLACAKQYNIGKPRQRTTVACTNCRKAKQGCKFSPESTACKRCLVDELECFLDVLDLRNKHKVAEYVRSLQTVYAGLMGQSFESVQADSGWTTERIREGGKGMNVKLEAYLATLQEEISAVLSQLSVIALGALDSVSHRSDNTLASISPGVQNTYALQSADAVPSSSTLKTVHHDTPSHVWDEEELAALLANPPTLEDLERIRRQLQLPPVENDVG